MPKSKQGWSSLSGTTKRRINQLLARGWAPGRPIAPKQTGQRRAMLEVRRAMQVE